jgi:hypothetical protein
MPTNFSSKDFISMLDALSLQVQIITKSRQYEQVIEFLKNEDDFYTDLNDIYEGIQEAKEAFEEMRGRKYQTVDNKTGK